MNLKHYSILFLILLLASCANRGIGPQGGPKDSIPPIPRSFEPEQGALNFKGKKIEIGFNEYIQLDNVGANLLMSPPQQTPPDVKARGKNLIVTFKDSLLDSTTYTIDFGAAVCDYTEKNPLRGFNFYFSTGPEIDTLEYRGRVFDAATLNPVKGVLTGIHSDLSDSAFTNKTFLRIAKTDSAGVFRIGNIHPGTYRLYAVDDISRDYRLTISEALAFADEPISVQPAAHVKPIVPDTTVTQNSTVIQDSIIAHYQIPITNDLTPLFLFKEEQQKLYLQRTQREEQHRILVTFSSPPDSLPVFRPTADSVHYYVQYSAHGDTATIWLTDSATIRMDSLYFEARYRRTDSLFLLEWYTDTLRAIWRAPKLTAKAQEVQNRKNRNRRLELRCNGRKDFELNDTLRLTCSTPLAMIDQEAIHLFQRVDTVLTPVPFTIAPHDSIPMSLTFLADLQAGQSYELHLDSAALHDIYGISHITASYSMTLKKPADYSTLRVKLKPFAPNARIQVLNSKDIVLRELPADPEGAFFEFLKPDTYYMRLYLDLNGDGKWTTGAWATKRQPEPVYYYPEKITTKSNWDFEEEWDYTAVPQTEAKPKELIKAAPQKK